MIEFHFYEGLKMIEIIKNLPVPVIIAISTLIYIIIAIIFTFLFGLVTHNEDYAMAGLLWVVAVPILVSIWLIIGLLSLFLTIYDKANEISLCHHEKDRRG